MVFNNVVCHQGLGSGQFKYRNLRSGAEPDRKTSNPDAAVHVDLRATFFVRAPDVGYPHQAAEVEPAVHKENYYATAAGLLRPTATSRAAKVLPPTHYKWRDTIKAVEALSGNEAANPYDGKLLEYTHPSNGGHTLPTLSAQLQLLPPSAQTKEHRHTGMTMYLVVRGEGATTVNIPDTVGYTMPEEYGHIIRTLRERVRGIENVIISTHCHNDLGMAVANSLAAIGAGARQIECTINGIGERAGNAALEEVVMAMRVRPDRYPYTTAIVGEEIFPTSQLLSEITHVAVQPNKAITGRNAFAHEAGIHQHGMLQNPLTYEIMTPHSVGVPDSRLVLGKHSGRHALAVRCSALGYTFDRRDLDEIYRRFVVLADRIKIVEDHDLLPLIVEVHSQSAGLPAAGKAQSSTGFAQA